MAIRRSASLCYLAAFFVVTAHAQGGAIGIPGLGFAHDASSHLIRSINGIPGAATIGEAADGSRFSFAEISPGQDLALALSTADRRLYAVRLPAVDEYAIAGATPALSRIVFSPAGRSAVLVGERLQILTGLPASPTVVDLAEPASVLETGMIAITDDAQQLLLSSTDGGTTTLWLVVPGSAPQPLPLSSPMAAAAFRPGGHDAIAVTRSGDIFLIQNPRQSVHIRLIFAGDSRTSDPVAIRLSADGKTAYTVSSRGIVTSVDLLAGSAASAQCDCQPTGLYPMRSDSLFRITEISDSPMKLFDASAPLPRVWFVPVDMAVAAAGGGEG
ncbi:MAG: hypothetical protein ABI759_05985 [Candidatus Solibacter sp.]